MQSLGVFVGRSDLVMRRLMLTVVGCGFFLLMTSLLSEIQARRNCALLHEHAAGGAEWLTRTDVDHLEQNSQVASSFVLASAFVGTGCLLFGMGLLIRQTKRTNGIKATGEVSEIPPGEPE